MSEFFDHKFRVALVGDGEVGKTTLRGRIADDNFEKRYIATVGMDKCDHTLRIDGESIKIEFCDFAGQKSCRGVDAAKYVGLVDGVILMYDVTCWETFNSVVKSWIPEIDERTTNAHLCKMLVGNKCDAREKLVGTHTAKQFADSIGIPFLEISVKDETNVDEALKTMISNIMARNARSTASREPMPHDLDDLPIHFQVSGVREAALEVYRGARTVPSAVTLQPGGNNVGDAVMPVTVTVRQMGEWFKSAFGPSRTTEFNICAIQSRMVLQLFCHDSHVRCGSLISSLRRNTVAVDIAVSCDEMLATLASLVQQPLQVKKIRLRLHGRTAGEHMQACKSNETNGTYSAETFSHLLQALRKVPPSSKLKIFEIPTEVRQMFTGDPFLVVSAMDDCRNDPIASRILKLKPTEIPRQTIPAVDPDDTVTLWLPMSGLETFVEQSAVKFSRKCLVASSGFIRELLKDNPDEDRIPLPLDKLEARSVSVEALSLTAQLVHYFGANCSEEEASQTEVQSTFGIRSSAPHKLAWTAEFHEVFEQAFLPVLKDSDILAFRRQQALKLFGEILELGRFLELPFAYEFGLVGGVGVFSRRLDLCSPPESTLHATSASESP